MFSKERGTPNWFKMIWDYLRTPRFNPLNMTNDNRSILAFNLSYMMDEKELLDEALNTMLKWLKEGKVKPPIVKEYPFEQVAQAHHDLESGTTIGKLVLKIGDSCYAEFQFNL